MAGRPWIIPDEVRNYSEYKDIQDRSDERLRLDIMRAEAQIIKYCNNDFSSYDDVPDDIRVAAILLSEKYAYSAAKIKKGGVLSETFDDYAYTTDANAAKIEISELGLEALLEPYKKANSGNISMGLWRL